MFERAKCPLFVVVVRLLSHVWLFATAWTAARQASLFFTLIQSLLKLISTESVIPLNHLILCHPLLLLPSILPSIRVFSSKSTLCNRWPKYWSFSISPSNEYSGLISFSLLWEYGISEPGHKMLFLKELKYHELIQVTSSKFKILEWFCWLRSRLYKV